MRIDLWDRNKRKIIIFYFYFLALLCLLFYRGGGECVSAFLLFGIGLQIVTRQIYRQSFFADYVRISLLKWKWWTSPSSSSSYSSHNVINVIIKFSVIDFSLFNIIKLFSSSIFIFILLHHYFPKFLL